MPRVGASPTGARTSACRSRLLVSAAKADAKLKESAMRGVAVVDHQPNAGQVAVWITARDGDQATNVNAVVIDVNSDPEAMTKVLSLVHRCVVLGTEGTTLDGLPIEGDALGVADVSALLDEVEAQQSRILDAIADHKQRTRSRSLVEPTFPARPAVDDFVPAEDTASQRALATANYFGRSWSAGSRLTRSVVAAPCSQRPA